MGYYISTPSSAFRIRTENLPRFFELAEQMLTPKVLEENARRELIKLRGTPWGTCEGCGTEYTLADKEVLVYCYKCGMRFDKDE